MIAPRTSQVLPVVSLFRYLKAAISMVCVISCGTWATAALSAARLRMLVLRAYESERLRKAPSHQLQLTLDRISAGLSRRILNDLSALIHINHCGVLGCGRIEEQEYDPLVRLLYNMYFDILTVSINPKRAQGQIGSRLCGLHRSARALEFN